MKAVLMMERDAKAATTGAVVAAAGQCSQDQKSNQKS